jgi:hypothetical protein
MIIENKIELVAGKKKQKHRVVIFECDFCHTIFTPKKLEYKQLKNKNHYCKLECAYDNRRTMGRSLKPSLRKAEVECFYCKKVVLQWKNQIAKYEHHFCSKPCRGAAIREGLIASNARMNDEIKQKLRASAIERFSDKTNHPRFGKHHTEEAKEKISKHHKETGCLQGEKNPMYGKSHSVETRQKMSEIVSSEMVAGKRRAYGKNFHEKGYVYSEKLGTDVFYRSSWEKAVIGWLDKAIEIKTFKYEPFAIPYFQKESERLNRRNYIPDFLVEYIDGRKELWEIKPAAFSESVKVKQKQLAAEEYCRTHDIDTYKLLTKQTLLEMNIL